MEQSIADKERQSIAKHQEEIKEQGAREQQRLAEQNRIETERRATEQRAKEERERQEKLRKESEKKKAEQRKKYSIAGHGNDIVTQTVRIAETSVHMLADDTKNIIRMSKELLQKRAEKKELSESECNKVIKTYETVKNNVEQLDKVNKNLDTLKDKKVIEKYETTKKSLEKKVCDTLEITKDKPKFLQSKKAVETSFREKIGNGLADLKAKADICKGRLAEINKEKKTQTSHREEKPASRTASRTIKPQTQTRARGR